MSDREPAVLRDGPAAAGTAAPVAPPRPSQPMLQRPTSKREAPSVYVVGFWKRFAAAAIDFFVILPVAIVITFIVSKVANVHLPAKNIKLLDVDMWIDLVLAGSSALVMALGLFIAIALTYLLVFHITLGRTLGMRVLKMKVIDVYGDPPSPARCVARCAGYLAGVATLFLGFLWIGFDNEKRGLQDWIAGTYVIRV
ncbi:MAG TPA: RDD family protein [Kofleriaceae bacterium]